MIDQIKWDANGLIPAIVQDDITGNVLMLAYMNKEAYQKTDQTKEAWFFSRSRKELWHKGASSGNIQKVVSMTLDCDFDTLLLTVEPQGPACHTGEKSCFFNKVTPIQNKKRDVIHQIIETIEHRKENPQEGAYTSYLFNEGIDKVLKKVGEEASEVIIAAKNDDKDEIKWEVADLVYHTLVLLNMTDVSLDEIKAVLYERHIKKEGK